MFKTDLVRSLAATVATVLVSGACLFGALGPAQPHAGQSAVAVAARFVA